MQDTRVTILSFGFKYGVPRDADFVFDVRFLPNPFYIDELRELTGKDRPAADYVMNNEIAETFLAKLTEMLRFLVKQFQAKERERLTVAIGCTGGRHRSVAVAEAVFAALSEELAGAIRITHRELNRGD